MSQDANLQEIIEKIKAFRLKHPIYEGHWMNSQKPARFAMWNNHAVWVLVDKLTEKAGIGIVMEVLSAASAE